MALYNIVGLMYETSAILQKPAVAYFKIKTPLLNARLFTVLKEIVFSRSFLASRLVINFRLPENGNLTSQSMLGVGNSNSLTERKGVHSYTFFSVSLVALFVLFL